MMGTAPPYRNASDSVRTGAWVLIEGQAEIALGDWLPIWDVSQQFKARRQFEIDLDAVYETTHLAVGTPLSLSISYVTDYEGDAARVELREAGGVIPVNVDVELAGEDLGTSLSLHSRLTLDVDLDRVEDPRAWRRGSVLWEDAKRVRLYGESSQLPVMEANFADAGLDSSAPWFLNLGTDLELPAMGSILLLLNDGFPIVREAARDFSSDRRDLGVVRSLMRADVGRTLVEYALAQDDLEREWPEESLGEVLVSLVQRMGNVSELRIIRERDPHKWAASIAGVFGLLREPLR